jgi:hypothetical protein
MRWIIAWLMVCSVALGIASGCGGQKPPAPVAGGGNQQNAAAESGKGTAHVNAIPPGNALPKQIALQFVPAQATAVLLKDHQALREFGLPFFLDPARGFDGRMGESFAEREIELSVLATLGETNGLRGGGGEAVACLKLAPDATVQRLVNAAKLKPDDKTYPGFTCYRGAVEGEPPMLVAQRQTIVAIAPEALLKPRLVANPPAGPVEKRMQPLAADHELIICCLTDYHDLELASGYLQPLMQVVHPWLEDLRPLPPGACNAITCALRLRNKPELLVRAEAADSSLAAEMSELIKRSAEKLKSDFAALRTDLKNALPPSGADEIDEFLSQAVEGLAVRKQGQEIDVTLPLGKDGAAFKRFVELVQQDRGQPFDRALQSAQMPRNCEIRASN